MVDHSMHDDHSMHAAMDHGGPAHDAHDTASDGEVEGMDHQAEEHGDMMKMYFHGGYNEVILFSFWRISTVGGLVGSMIGCFLLGVLYEGLKFFREFLLRTEYRSAGYSNVSPAPSDTIVEDGSDSIISVEPAIRPAGQERIKSDIKIIQTNLLSKGHMLQTVLQLVQIILSYCLMLIFMTYNTWLCAAVAMGATTGFFLFGWKKTVVLDVGGEHCH
eukprot:GFUD01058072.1.p1 GENE.GFUD01058072.1~~GFUD01058072.1.p1  ORF type:complete len:235 (-),score=72.07 GFUD01058072.1:419-1069(-)